MEKVDDFIGTTFDTGRGVLTVTGHNGLKSNKKKYTVECSICSEDKEMYPEGFNSQKSSLVEGKLPCGCAFNPRLDNRQSILNLQRVCDQLPQVENKGRYTVLNVIGKDGRTTKIFSLTCSVCSKDRELFPEGSITSKKYNITIGKLPCGCAKSPQWTQAQYEIRIKRLLDQEGGVFTGWSGENKGGDNKFNWTCKKGHEAKTSITKFINEDSRCITCAKQEVRNGFGLYFDRVKEDDCLYLIECLDSNDNVVCIKAGRSFPDNIDRRFKQIERGLGLIERGLGLIVRPYRIIKADHQTIFNIEQTIINKGRFTHYYNEYTTEALKADQLAKVDIYLDGVVTAYENQIISDLYY